MWWEIPKTHSSMGVAQLLFLYANCRLAPVLKTFFINVSYNILVASLTLMALF